MLPTIRTDDAASVGQFYRKVFLQTGNGNGKRRPQISFVFGFSQSIAVRYYEVVSDRNLTDGNFTGKVGRSAR
jgi:hypothetical protein